MLKLLLSIKLFYLDLSIAMMEEQFERLTKELPGMRERREALAEQVYAADQDQPA